MKTRQQYTQEFLDIDLLGRLPSLEVQAKYLVSGFLSGLHRSPYRGSSAEFKEYRDYQQGDPLKLIDWKVFARTDKLHVRLHDDETNMNVYIVLDHSASMNYKGKNSSMSKWEYACSLAAALMLFLKRQQDCFTLSLLSEELDNFIRPSTTQNHFLKMLGKLEYAPLASSCNWANGLESLIQVVRTRSIVILISDFYTNAAELSKQLNRFNFHKCEMIFLNVMDRTELDLNLEGSALLNDMESGDRLMLSPDLLRKDYLDKINTHISQLRDVVQKHGGDYLLLPTDTLPLTALGKYLSVRSERFK